MADENEGQGQQTEQQHTINRASLLPIYERLNAAPAYHPLDADTFADWSMDAGDQVSVTRDGTSYTSPIHAQRITWRKGAQVQLSSTGNKQRPSLAKMSQMKYEGKSAAGNATGGGGGYGSSRYLHWYVQDKYGQMQSGLELTTSSATLYVRNLYEQMQSGLELTSSSAHLYVYNNYEQMQSGLALTSSSAALYVNNMYTQMSSGLALTSSSLAAYVEDRYSALSSRLEMTSGSFAASVENWYTQMCSGLELTSSSAHLYAKDKGDELESGLTVTENSVKGYANSRASDMNSGFTVTSNTVQLYANTRAGNMSSGFTATLNSAKLYARSGTNAAIIFAHANAAGSGITLNANRIKITGNTTFGGEVTISGGSLNLRNSLMVDGSLTVIKSTGIAQAPKLETQYNGRLDFYTDNDVPRPLTYTNIGGIFNSASISDNQLTLTTVDGVSVPFRKATSYSGPTWSVYNSNMGKIVITPTQNNVAVPSSGYQQFIVDSGTKQNADGTAYSSGDTWYIPVYAKASEYGSSTETGLRVYVNAAAERTNGQNEIEVDTPYWDKDGDTVAQQTSTANTLYFKTKNRPGSQLYKYAGVYLDTGSWSGRNRAIYARLSGYNGTKLCKKIITAPEPTASMSYSGQNSDITNDKFYATISTDRGGSASQTFYLQNYNGTVYLTVGGYYPNHSATLASINGTQETTTITDYYNSTLTLSYRGKDSSTNQHRFRTTSNYTNLVMHQGYSMNYDDP